MKFSCAASDLQNALNIVTKALAARSTLPVLEGVLVRTGEEQLTLTCSDTSITIVTHLPAHIEEHGQSVLPGRLFMEVARRMPSGTIQAASNLAGVVTLRCQGSRTSMNGMDGTQFPRLPEVDSENAISLPQPLLREMIQRTAFAIATDDARQVLTGSLLDVARGEVRMVALDGFRLAMRTARISDVEMKFSAIIPGKSLSELGKLLGDDEDARVQLRADRNMMHASLSDTDIYMRLIDGEFIDYRRILPSDWKCRVQVDCGQLRACVDRASLMAREGKNNLVRLNVYGDDMIITSNSEVGDVHEEVRVDHEGDDLLIAFNVRYIMDVMRAIDDEVVSMRFNTSVSPCVIAPPEGDEYLYLVLPVRINA